MRRAGLRRPATGPEAVSPLVVWTSCRVASCPHLLALPARLRTPHVGVVCPIILSGRCTSVVRKGWRRSNFGQGHRVVRALHMACHEGISQHRFRKRNGRRHIFAGVWHVRSAILQREGKRRQPCSGSAASTTPPRSAPVNTCSSLLRWKGQTNGYVRPRMPKLRLPTPTPIPIFHFPVNVATET